MLEFFREGTPFWVRRSVVGNALNVPLVRTGASKAGVAPFGSGTHLMEENRLILLGFYFNFVAADGNGFNLEFIDFQFSPGGYGRPIIAPRAATGGLQVTVAMPFCFIPGPQGFHSPTGDVRDGADIQLTTTATGPTSGEVVIWGIHVDANWKPGKTFTGSPIDF